MVPRTEIKVNNKQDTDPTLHVDVHLTLVETVDTNTLLESAKLTKRSVTSVAKKDILHLFCCSRPKSTLRSSSSAQQGNGKSKPQQHYTWCSAHEVDDHPDFQFECDSINIVSKRHSNVSQHILFDEISDMDHILTDLNVSFLHSTTATKIRFKVDSGACANLLPFKVLKCIEPSVTVSKLHDSIDHSVCLYAYNKHVIKQFGVQHLKVSFGNKTKVIPLFIVDSRFNPIVGLSDSFVLKLIKLNAPMYNTWSSNNPVSTIATVGTNQNHNTMQNNEVPEKLTKQCIINLPKYRHLFQGIGKFKINPVSITLQKDTTPVQKPPWKVPLAMQKAFKEELDSMEQQGITSKYDTKQNKAPEWLNSFVIVKKQMADCMYALILLIWTSKLSDQSVTH